MDIPVESQIGEFVRFERSEIEQSITNRFEKIVARAPGGVAVKSHARELTYDALNQAANRVAHAVSHLRSTVAEPVALLLDQEDRTVSTILGVLKTGKFYVPLDPSSPRERLSFVLQDCQPRILITDSKYSSLARELAPLACSVAHVDELHDGAGGENTALAISPDAVAAVFYTSGSTGRPKGVLQTHRLVLHRIMGTTNSFRISSRDRLSLLTSPSYSASLRHLFGALLNGATVCPFNIADQGLTALAAWLSRENITMYHSVPAMFRQLMGSVNGTEDFHSLRVVHLVGESVTGRDFELYRKHLPATCVFVNSLSSNETGTFRMYVADKATYLSGTTVPAGYEVDDKEVLILDDDGRELGPNELGRIAVRSEFLSPGYWGQADLTAAAFRPDPNAEQKRIYCTGDLGILLPDGCLIYKGRKDFRAKIRGIQVEVEEIDAALRLHPSVSQAVVVAPEDHDGQPRLVAYVVTRRAASITVSELRTFLSDKLPAYMIPSSFMFLDALPRTPHGKVDRLALPPPDQARPRIQAEFVAPKDKLERDLAKLCESILRIHPIGVRDNVFDLGIDSLVILQLIAAIEKNFRKHLPPATLFHSPTIAQLAAILRNETFPESRSSLVPIQPTGTKPPFFWIHGDFSAILLSRYLGPDQPLYHLEHQGQDGRPALYTNVDVIAAYYLQEIQKVQANGPYFIGGYSFGAVVAFELAQQVTQQGERVRLLALLDPPSLARHNLPSSSVVSVPSESTRSSFAGELRRHMRNLATLTLKERIAYIRARAMDKTAGLLTLPVMKRSAKTAIYRICLALGCRLPVFVRILYIFDIYMRALRKYVPQPYSGRVIFFKGKDRKYGSQDWEQVIAGDCEVHTVETPHLQMREEPYIHLWAETLGDGLSKAQGEMSPHASAVPCVRPPDDARV